MSRGTPSCDWRKGKMAATGEEAAAMDSISRVPPVHPTVLSLGGSSEPRGEPSETAADGQVVPAAPKKPTSSSDGGVETAEEAVEPDINELCTDMFDKMAVFLQGELTGTCEDYRLLENMNKLTSLKYMEMKDISINISRNLQDLNLKCMFTSLSNVRGKLATLYENDVFFFFYLNLAEKYIVLCVRRQPPALSRPDKPD
uniref:Biogenesis of lysosomal organelles complex-1, subunit 2 n=1 Tax=Oncorhynchus mykiss TaxID=8022 RepID=A0A8K9X552_ONCMY